MIGHESNTRVFTRTLCSAMLGKFLHQVWIGAGPPKLLPRRPTRQNDFPASQIKREL